MNRSRLGRWALAAATLAAFAPVLAAGFFVLDDIGFVVDNPRVASGLSLANLRWALFTDHAANWMPLTWLSHQADVALFGLAPFGHHLTNLLLHALNAVLAALALERLTGQASRSLAVAALFALHPLRVESVAWVAERKDLLAGAFFLLAMLAYAAWTRRGGALRYLALVAAATASLLSKSMTVTLPFVLLLLDRWPLARSRGASLRLVEKLPLFALAAAASWMTMAAQTTWGAVARAAELSVGQRLANACVAPFVYLAKTVWPFDLSVLYPHPYLPGGAPPSAAVVALCAALLAVTVAAALATLRDGDGPAAAPGVGALWFLGMLVPVLGLVQVGEQALADRYTYLPHLGLFVALVWGGAELARRAPSLARAAPALGALLLVALGVRTFSQAALWRDPRALLESSLRATPTSPVLLAVTGRSELAAGRVELAEARLALAVTLRPLYSEARADLARVYLAQGRTAEARDQLRLALRIQPDYAPALRDLEALGAAPP